MSRASGSPTSTRPALAVLALALVVFYISGLPTLLHFGVEHASAGHVAQDGDRAPVTPLNDHTRDCGAWDFVTHAGIDAPPPTLAVAVRGPIDLSVAIVAPTSHGLFAPDTSRPRGPPAV